MKDRMLLKKRFLNKKKRNQLFVQDQELVQDLVQGFVINLSYVNEDFLKQSCNL